MCSQKSKATITATTAAIKDQVTAAVTVAVEEQAMTTIKEQVRMTTADSSTLGTFKLHADFGMEVNSTVMKSFKDAPNSKAAHK